MKLALAILLLPLLLPGEAYNWHGGAKGRWEDAACWEPRGVPGRLDTVVLTKEATIDLGRDRMISNIVFSAKVILAGGAVHAQRTLGRGAKAKLGVRAFSLLGNVVTKDGAEILPLKGKAGYKGVLVTDERKGVVRVIETRPAASYVWTGAAGDGKWVNEKNWLVNGRPALETPVDTDSVLFSRNHLRQGFHLRQGYGEQDGGQEERKDRKGDFAIELPYGVTVISNLVMETTVTWRRERRAAQAIDGEDAGEANAALPCLDVLDLTGNEKFIVRGEVQFCAKGPNATTVPIVAEKGTRLALASHNHVPYKDVAVESGATLMPFDYAVEFERLTLKPGHKMAFSPPRHFNRWRPVWVMHAKNLNGEPNYPKIPGWHPHVEKLGDGSTLLAIAFGEE